MIPDFYLQNLDLNKKPDECHRALSLSSCSWAFIIFASIFFARLEVADLEYLTSSRVSLLNTSATYLIVIPIVTHNALSLYLGMSSIKREAIHQRSEMCGQSQTNHCLSPLSYHVFPFLHLGFLFYKMRRMIKYIWCRFCLVEPLGFNLKHVPGNNIFWPLLLLNVARWRVSNKKDINRNDICNYMYVVFYQVILDPADENNSLEITTQ